MDLEVARKSLSKRSAFPAKKIAFAVVAGLVLVAGIGLRVSHYVGEAPTESEPAAVEAPAPEAAPPPPEAAGSVPKTPPVMQKAAPPPSEPAEQVDDTAEQTKPEGDAVGQSGQADLPGAGMILVARKPVEVRAGPSASAPAMFGFPAGRPFRVIGREGGFVRIQDLKSSASGWIDETALATPPPSAPAVAAPSQAKPGTAGQKPSTASADPKPQAAKKGAPAPADSEVAEPYPTQTRRPPVLFGKGGFFGGIFGGGNN